MQRRGAKKSARAVVVLSSDRWTKVLVRGKPLLSKSLFEWPKEASAQRVSNGKVTSVVTQKPGNPLDAQARALNDSDTFEAR